MTMNKKFDWLKNNLMGSTTMPLGTGLGTASGFSVLQSGHVHNEDGSCCGHDHGPGLTHQSGHVHTADCGHDHSHGADCGHDHNQEEEDCTSPKTGCC
jgi:hypothetical protein